MKIRKTTLKDVNAIAKLVKTEFNKKPYNDGWTDFTSQKAVRSFLKKGLGFVATEGNKIIGAIIANEEPYAKGTYWEIQELVVGRKFQRKGIGKKLVERLEDFAKKKKVATIYFSTHKKSEAFKFYKKMKYSVSKDMVIMGKKIK